MTEHESEKPEAKPSDWQIWRAMPWQWKVGLVRMALALVFGFCGVCYAAYQFFTGDPGAAFGWALVSVVGARILAGGLYNIDRR